MPALACGIMHSIGEVRTEPTGHQYPHSTACGSPAVRSTPAAARARSGGGGTAGTRNGQSMAACTRHEAPDRAPRRWSASIASSPTAVSAGADAGPPGCRLDSLDAEQPGLDAPAGALTPIYDLVVGTVLSSTKLFADGTTLPVLDPGRGPDQGLDGCWCYAVDDRPWCGPISPCGSLRVFREDRKGAHPAGHLAGFSGAAPGRRLCRLQAAGRGSRRNSSVRLAVLLEPGHGAILRILCLHHVATGR